VKIPGHFITMLQTVFKGKGMAIPEGAEAILEADFESPRSVAGPDFQSAHADSQYDDTATVFIQGTTPEGAVIRIFIQAAGLRSIPSGLAKFAGGKHAQVQTN
jgi:hypothetical protein